MDPQSIPKLGRSATSCTLMALALLGGCVERTMTIQSTPSGADVFVDGKPVGSTPVEVPFVWYGTREIVVEKDTFETVRAVEDVPSPWWQYPGFDLLTDVLIPVTFTDAHEFSYDLTPSPETVDPEPIERSALELKRRLYPDDPKQP